MALKFSCSSPQIIFKCAFLRFEYATLREGLMCLTLINVKRILFRTNQVCLLQESFGLKFKNHSSWKRFSIYSITDTDYEIIREGDRGVRKSELKAKEGCGKIIGTVAICVKDDPDMRDPPGTCWSLPTVTKH